MRGVEGSPTHPTGRLTVKRFASSLAVAALAVSALASTPPDGCYPLSDAGTPGDASDDPLACQLDTYIKANPARIGNVHGVTGQDANPTFSTDAPAGSYEAGNGGMTAVAWPGTVATDYTDEKWALTVEGEFTGNLDNLAVELYAVNPVGQYGFEEFWSQLHLEVDGVTVFDTYGAEHVITNYAPVDDTTVRLRFAFTDVWEALGSVDDAGPHDVKFQITGFTYGDEAAFIYDASEYPSHMKFNLKKLAGYQTIEAGV